MKARAIASLVVLLGAGFACSRQKPAPPSPAPVVSREQSGVALAPSADSKPVPRPPPSGAPRALREQAVSSILHGQQSIHNLPEIATDDGGVVDQGLRDRLAPRDGTQVLAE
jgi:hypothetical protein